MYRITTIPGDIFGPGLNNIFLTSISELTCLAPEKQQKMGSKNLLISLKIDMFVPITHSSNYTVHFIYIQNTKMCIK